MSVVISEERVERSQGRPGAVIGGVAVFGVALVAFLVRVRTRRVDALDLDASAIPAALRRDVGLPPSEPVKDWQRF